MLLSRMGETGNLGNHAQSRVESLLSSQDDTPTRTGDSQDFVTTLNGDIDFSSYDVKLKDGASSPRHDKNLSEEFSDVLSIGDLGDETKPPVQDEIEASSGADVPPYVSGPSVTVASLKGAAMLDPKSGVEVPSNSAQINMYCSMLTQGMQYQQYDRPTGDQPTSQYSYPLQTHQLTSNQTSADASGYFVPPPPPTLTPGSSDSRKHRREISEHHPMAHRRKNTYGESENTKWSYERDNEVDVFATIQEYQQQTPPSDGSQQHINYSYPFQGNPSQMPYGGFFAPPIYNVSSSHSDSGASYNMGSGVPVMTAYESRSLRTSPNPASLYSGQQHEYWNQANEGYQGYTAALKSRDDDESAQSDSHHRKQSSLGAFLATAGIFEEVYHEMEGQGYNSAPENIEENAIQADTEPIFENTPDPLSASAVQRNLSEDSFFKQFFKAIHEVDDADVVAAAAAVTEQKKYTADNSTSAPAACLPVGAQFQGNLRQASAPHKLVLKQTATAAVDPNRHRRKCAVAECPNRVVQGGLCISHGAKRKTCNFPGCTKNVKKQGKCSAHGPERKRCEAEGCTKVAVQGGKCISHGAKKKECGIEGCSKQSIIGGMCKKHHDEYHGVVKVRAVRKARAPKSPRESHVRGLSVFNDQETVDRIVNSSSPINMGNQA